MDDLPIKEILYAASVRNALVVLADGTTRQQLESLQPDMQRMMSVLNTSQLNGVMVTCQGTKIMCGKCLVQLLGNLFGIHGASVRILRAAVTVILQSQAVHAKLVESTRQQRQGGCTQQKHGLLQVL